MPPGRKVAVLTCMDARIDPAHALGLEEGDAHVIRNAGGRAADALRSLVISDCFLREVTEPSLLALLLQNDKWLTEWLSGKSLVLLLST